jgi:glycosyltransferase involved in cell wall biosynthesis
MSSVDVIVPCYRYGHFLRECVESVLAQEGVRVRALVIDDASPDDTRSIGRALAHKDSRVTFRRHEHNAGHIATYNEGLEWASADYLLLLSADDYLLPGALQRATALLDSHLTMSFVYGHALEWEHLAPRPQVGDETRDGPAERVISGKAFILQSQARSVVATPTAVVRTAAQKKAGGYRPSLPHSGDLEMWWRLACLGEVGVLASSQAVYRRHAINMSHDYLAIANFEQRAAAVRSFLDHGCLPRGDAAEVRKVLEHDLARYAVDLANNAFILGEDATQNELLRRALALDSHVRCSLPWLKLACKRLAGHSACLWMVSRFARDSCAASLIAAHHGRAPRH